MSNCIWGYALKGNITMAEQAVLNTKMAKGK